MPSYLATSNNDAIETAEQVLLDGTQTIAGVEDVLVDGQSVVIDNVAHIDLSGKQDKLTVTQDLTLDGAELGVNKEKIQEKLSAGNNIEIIDNVISAKAAQPNIDSIAVNRTALIPDENKQVNITIDKATVDLSNVDNTSDINKPVSTAQQAAIDAVADKLNKDVVTDVTFTLNGDTLDATVNRENLSTGSKDQSGSEIISGATQDSAGLMTAADVKSLSDLQTRVGNLEGKTTRLLYTEKTNPTATEINTFVTGLGYTAPFDGIAVVIQGTYHIWHYYSNDNIGWRDDGQDTVSTFTNDIAGIIKGAGETDGKIYAETDGTGSVYGWDALKTQVEENKNKLANKADVSLLNSKLDSVTSATTANQAYTKNADGTQKMENIYATAEPNSIAYRDENGRLKAADGDADDDVLTRGQYNTYITAAVSGLEHTDNKVSAIEGEGSDIQYPSTKAVVDYVESKPYHINITGDSGAITQDQYDKLFADKDSYITRSFQKFIRVTSQNDDAADFIQYVFLWQGVTTYYIMVRKNLTFQLGAQTLQDDAYKKTSITDGGNDTDYPTTKAVVDYTAAAIEAGVSGCERTDNKVTAITSEGSDVQYPSAKAAYDYGQTIQTNAQTYANTAETNAKSYTDTKTAAVETAAKTYTDTQIGTSETTVKGYADTQATAAETNAKAYADSLIGNVNEWLTKIDSGEGV